MQKQVTPEVIERFFDGYDPMRHIVAIEANYFEDSVTLIINDPNSDKENPKRKIKDKFHPFFWMKDAGLNELYGGDRRKLKAELRKENITVKLLKTTNDAGFEPERLKNGYKYLITGNGSYLQLLNFFKAAGCEVAKNKNFITLSPTEQYMIQSGKRLFKGIEDYNDVHRLQFDLETTSLDPTIGYIEQIGIRDNRGFECILEIDGPNKLAREREAIEMFFSIIDELKPDVIEGHNSESFDWPFIFERCRLQDIDITDIAKTLNSNVTIKRHQATLKLGQDTEYYEQTYMWGYNITDTIHSVRRAQAINSDIKSAGLKYIIKFSEIVKDNRVYVPGNLISKLWNDKENQYAFNNTNGDWYKITDAMPIQDGYEVVDGKFIDKRYLLDDLWETEQVGTIFNQASFLLAKILPTSFMRVLTMGTASVWKLIMQAWSYENSLAIPEFDKKREFTGGLSRLLRVGKSGKYSKLDYAALYPKTQITHDIFSEIDISGVMKGLLIYIVETRDKYKALKGEFEDSGNFKTAGIYDRKQLPLKILANSFFGSYGAPDVFPWSVMDLAEETTCRGRMYLRLLVKFFTEKYGFKPLVLDTDGVNFEMPLNINELKYTSIGNHKFTQKDKEYFGVKAVVAEFNDTYMIGMMGLDIDEIGESTINFARKNYTNKVIKKGKIKIKLVGNTIKSKKLPTYIEEFLDKAIVLLLDDKGCEFIALYQEYVEKIYNYEIPLAKIASKSKVKIHVDEYKQKSKKKNKAGKPMPKQAHMELIIQHNLKPDLGDVIYYVNTGTKKSHGDIKTEKGVVKLNCKLISASQIEENPDLITEEYNVPKYLDAFNNRIQPLLVVFKKEIRDKILFDIKMDKKTKKMVLSEPHVFKNSDCELIAGVPDEPKDQDDYQTDLMDFEDKEIKFWIKVNKTPNNLEDIGVSLEEWEKIKSDYLDKIARLKDKELAEERIKLDNLIKRLEIDNLTAIDTLLNDGNGGGNELQEILNVYFKIAYLGVNDDEEIVFMSKKYDEEIGKLDDIKKYEADAMARDEFYETLNDDELKDAYNIWVKHVEQQKILNGEIVVKQVTEPGISIKENEVLKSKIDITITKQDDEWNF